MASLEESIKFDGIFRSSDNISYLDLVDVQTFKNLEYLTTPKQNQKPSSPKKSKKEELAKNAQKDILTALDSIAKQKKLNNPNNFAKTTFET